MQSEKSKTSEPTRKISGHDCEFEIKFIPCPPEQRESYWQAMKILNKLIEQAIELSQVNNDPYPPALSPNQKTDLEKESQEPFSTSIRCAPQAMDEIN